MTSKDRVEHLLIQGEIQQPKRSIRQRQPLADVDIERGAHGNPFRKKILNRFAELTTIPGLAPAEFV